MPILVLLLLLFPATLARAQATETATYQIAFESFWDASHVESGTLPAGAHFTRLVGTPHVPATPLWVPGTLATQGTEDVAETGNTNAVQGEIAALQSAGDAGDYLDVGNAFDYPIVNVQGFSVDPQHSRLSVISMIAPSPDWFIGVSSLPLQDAADWQTYRVVSLHPYDAGTENGQGFSLNNPDSMPQELIRPISGSPFVGRPVIGRLHLLRVPGSGGPSGPCGDVAFDLSVDLKDVVVFRRYLADPNAEVLFDGDPSRCATIAPSGSCDSADLAALIRGIAGLAPGIAPECLASG